jgi:hypothetical protein
MLAKPPSTDHVTIHKSDRHSRPSPFGQNYQPGKRSRFFIPMVAANSRQVTSTRSLTMPLHYTMPHQPILLTPLPPRTPLVAASWMSSNSEPSAARLSCMFPCMADAHSPAFPLDFPKTTAPTALSTGPLAFSLNHALLYLMKGGPHIILLSHPQLQWCSNCAQCYTSCSSCTQCNTSATTSSLATCSRSVHPYLATNGPQAQHGLPHQGRT